MSNKLYYLSLLSACFLVCSCDEASKKNSVLPETLTIDVKENRDPYFFATNYSFDFTESDFIKIENLLRDSRADGADNISFMLTSNKFIPVELQEKVKDRIILLMNKFGFINSRIVDSGICVYKDAKTGIRINILRYTVKETDCNPWSESIGDIDMDKSLPKMRASTNYNLEEMIANKADLIAPRKYLGQTTSDAISAMKSSGGSSSGSSSDSTSSSSSSSSSGSSKT